MKGVAVAVVLVLVCCGAPEPRRVPVRVDACTLDTIRVIALAEEDACAAQDPRGDDGPTSTLAVSPWTAAADAATLELEIAPQDHLAVVAQCADAAEHVARWGCGALAGDEVRVALEPICAAACPDPGDACGPDAVGWTGAGGSICVPACDDCGEQPVDEDDDGYAAPTDCDDRDPDVFPGTTRPCDETCGEGSQTCEETATWGPCISPGGDCAPLATRARACGACGTEHATCGEDCSWGPWEGCEAGECTPDDQEPCEEGCGARTCGADCVWGGCDAPCHCPAVIASGGVFGCVGDLYCVENLRACRERQTWTCTDDAEGCHWSRECVSTCP